MRKQQRRARTWKRGITASVRLRDGKLMAALPVPMKKHAWTAPGFEVIPVLVTEILPKPRRSKQ